MTVSDDQLAVMNGSRLTLSVPATLTIAEVESVAASIVDLLPEADDIAVDASAVQHIDLAGLQLLMAIALDAERSSVPFGWQAVSETFAATVNLAGLRAGLRIDVKSASNEE